MKISKEHILAFKISILLLIFALIITYSFQILNHNGIIDLSYQNKRQLRYIIFLILSIILYLISYILAKITINPIEENNKNLKEYNHNLAHEIKTPLSVLKSNLELLNLQYDPELLISSQEEITSMENITDSLLFLSENNQLRETENISISKFLKKYKGEDIIIEVQHEFTLKSNKGLIERLVKNLIENARKFGKIGDKIYVRVQKNSFTISNSFTGVITKKDIEKLSDIFYQADNSRNTNGYGLGLSMVKKIGNLHNLKIHFTVEKNNFIVKISRKKHLELF